MKKLISCSVREQMRYTKDELKSRLSCEGPEAERLIRNLKAYGVLKTVKISREQRDLSDLAGEEDLTGAAGEDRFYLFAWVGVIVAAGRVIRVCPKYLRSAAEPLQQMRLVMKVLERYQRSEEQVAELCHGDGEARSFNILAVILFLLRDYYEYGLYTSHGEVVERNGEGEILWERTIDQCLPLVRGGRPYYTELYARRTKEDDADYFRRLHASVLTECSRQLRECRLEELFDMVPVDFPEEATQDFGEREYVLERLRAELGSQFFTRNQILLKTLYAYLAQDEKLGSPGEEGLSLYGTNAFHMVWEKACAAVFRNKLRVPLRELGLSVPLAEGYDGAGTLAELIGRPVWKTQGAVKTAADTLTPDIIAVGQSGGADYFIILDAKYYNLQLEPDRELRGIPGVADITKQYLYELAFRPFLKAHRISMVRNCFLLPAESVQTKKRGVVCMEMLRGLGLADIGVDLLPVEEVFRHYLADTQMEAAVFLREETC